MNGSGKISWTEFLAATIETKGHISQEEFESAFDHLDLDKSGYISTSVGMVCAVLSLMKHRTLTSTVNPNLSSSEFERDYRTRFATKRYR